MGRPCVDELEAKEAPVTATVGTASTAVQIRVHPSSSRRYSAGWLRPLHLVCLKSMSR